jgi:hypothetical protein
MAFQYRLDNQGALLQRSVIPDGVSTELTVDFAEDLERIGVPANITPIGVYGVNEEKGAGTGADATDENMQRIPFTVTHSASEVTYIFERPPKHLFWVWVQFLISATKVVHNVKRPTKAKHRKHK